MADRADGKLAQDPEVPVADGQAPETAVPEVAVREMAEVIDEPAHDSGRVHRRPHEGLRP